MGDDSPDRFCLNCHATLQDNFCGHCGQSASTQRFSVTHIFSHDFLRTLFHFDKDFFFSLKELFTRPGHSIREYVEGKRKDHLNYISLLAILIILFLLIEGITPFHYSALVDSTEEKEILNTLEGVVKKYPKQFFIGAIPIYAFFSLLFFRKAKQNYAENFVLNAYKSSAFLFLNIIFLSIAIFIKDASMLKIIDSTLTGILVGYGAWFYYQYFSPFYKNKIFLFLRSLLCALMPLILIFLGLVIYIVYFTESLLSN